MAVDPELASIIRQMLEKGMPAEQIASTLEEMGIPDAKNVVYGVAAEMQGGPKVTAAPSSQPGASSPALSASGSSLGLSSAPLSGMDASKWDTPGKTLTTEEKLDEILALLKALQQVNKNILETDRSVLLRLKTETK